MEVGGTLRGIPEGSRTFTGSGREPAELFANFSFGGLVVISFGLVLGLSAYYRAVRQNDIFLVVCLVSIYVALVTQIDWIVPKRLDERSLNNWTILQL